jgi:phage tail protein X
MMMATTLVAVSQKKVTEPLFPAEVYGARSARALDALAALDACVRADLLRGPVAPETAPFVRPHQGTPFAADMLTWRFYHKNAGCVVHAINNAAYGAALTRALYPGLFGLDEEGAVNDHYDENKDAHIIMRADPPSLDRVRAALLSVRCQLRDTLVTSSSASSPSGLYNFYGYH